VTGSGARVTYIVGTAAGGMRRHVAMLADGCTQARLRVAVLDLAPIRRLRRQIADVDVVHAHGMRAGALAALARRRRRPALVVTVHNGPPATPWAAAVYRVLERIVARRADVVLCVSADLEARMRRRRAREVRHAIVPAPAAEVQSTRAPAGSRPVILGVGRLTRQKGFDLLLEAAGYWRGRQPEPQVVIAGSGPLAAPLASQARGLGIDVVFLGERHDVPALLSAAAVFVLPSRWEGQPLVLQEALRAGRPIVAADVGGVRAVAGKAALLGPAEDPAWLAAAVERLLDDSDLSARLAAAAVARAAELPTPADAINQVLGLYQRLLALSGTGAGRT
jgi:glycosyltransferase involved in cell wall biosynthesis